MSRYLRCCLPAYLAAISASSNLARGQGQPNPETQLPAVEMITPAATKVRTKTSEPIAPGAKSKGHTFEHDVKASVSSEPPIAFGFYDPDLDYGNLTLPSGADLTTAGPVVGYQALTTFSATKTATPIMQIPQSIQVVPRSLIEQQGNQTVSDAIQNVSSVSGVSEIRTPGYDFPTIRGFQSEEWIDGLSVFYDVGARDSIVNVERIEVLKGPEAILYGGGNGMPVGGAINIVSKMPTDMASREVGFTFGSENYLRPYFDINQPLRPDGTALFRVTGEYTSTGSFVDSLDGERYAINPTLTLTNKSDTTLTLQGRITNWQQKEYQGLPATGTIAGDFRIDPSLFPGPGDMPDAFSRIRALTLSLDHKMNDAISMQAKARLSEGSFFEPVQIYLGSDGLQANTPAIPPSTWILSNGLLTEDFQEILTTANIEAKFDAGLTHNIVLIGGDYSHINDSGFIGADFSRDAGFLDFRDPSFPTPYLQPQQTPQTAIGAGEKTYDNAGAFVQIQSTVGNRIHLLGGLRLADVDIHSKTAFTGARDEKDSQRLLPRLGAVFDVTNYLSVYASYAQGLRGQPLLNQAGVPDPEFSEQRETGIKLDLDNGLAGTVAVFQLDRTNVPIPEGFSISGTEDEVSRGVETDLTWQPNANWRVLGSMSFLDAEVTASHDASLVGNKLVAVPRSSGRLWINYSFDPGKLKGWSVGAGVYAASPEAVEFTDTYFTSSYYSVDARIGYDCPMFSASITVKNLTDQSYFVPYDFFRGRVVLGDPRTVLGTVAYRF